MKNVLITVSSFSARCVTGCKLLRDNQYNLIFKNSVNHLIASESDELRASIDAIIAGTDCYDASVFSLLPKLKIISRFGTGVDNIDTDAAKKSGIVVNNARGINANAVAEFIIGLVFSGLRNIPGNHMDMQNGYWGYSLGNELNDKRVGLLGFGNIAKTLVKRLSGFEIEILAYDKNPDHEIAEKMAVKFVSVDDIFMQSNVIVVLLPYTSSLENFISHKYLSMMRNGALLINAARGKLIDERALLQVIDERNVFSALDVFQHEPLPQFSPLLHSRNIITTPHIAAATVESYHQTGIHTARSVIDFFDGKTIDNILQ
ncbi:phosphoglycerate dehydrogenase [Citrobacter freundii]|uniref:phosphoglycerate dehydrogenase n=1 Tax=Citrobacter freundii TaxID=546 RepID=UPI000D139283|nr:phosphoglycerate dehydrogenase [Citrobacter freundii]PSM64378.1 phosphoglycerate dehydrogenase [Citrobacter freundii]